MEDLSLMSLLFVNLSFSSCHLIKSNLTTWSNISMIKATGEYSSLKKEVCLGHAVDPEATCVDVHIPFCILMSGML